MSVTVIFGFLCLPGAWVQGRCPRFLEKFVNIATSYPEYSKPLKKSAYDPMCPIRPEFIPVSDALLLKRLRIFLLPPGWDASPWVAPSMGCRYPFTHLLGERHRSCLDLGILLRAISQYCGEIRKSYCITLIMLSSVDTG